MKKIIIISLLFVHGVFSQAFQNNYLWNQHHFHDLNIERINEESCIVSGNIFDTGMNAFVPVALRLDSTGQIDWAKTFSSNGQQNLRFFDSVVYHQNGQMIAVTGSVEVNGHKKVFIATFELGSGLLIYNKYYDIVSPNFNSTGLHIIYTQADHDGDGFADPGFVVGGFFSNSYSLDTSAMNIGFVLRTSLDLTPVWTIEVDNTPGGNQDYNMVNKVVETPVGYFLTGGSNDPNSSQQGILAHMVDFSGTALWTNGYVYGNSRDVGVDAYYDPVSQHLFLLSNFSITHQFAITVFDLTGAVVNSWYYTENNLNHYGFSIDESLSDPNTLAITGYARQFVWSDANGSYTGQTNAFVCEIDKTTGAQVGHAKIFAVPHIEPSGDEYNFWNAQMPLIYYPDIAYRQGSPTGPYHYIAGYKTDSNYVEANVFKLPTYESLCTFYDLNFVANSFNLINFTNDISGPTPVTPYNTNTVYSDITPVATDCNGEALASGGYGSTPEWEAFPNPAGDTLYLSGINGAEYHIVNSAGVTVAKGTLPASSAIDTGNLSPGVYFLKITDGKTYLSETKFIKK